MAISLTFDDARLSQVDTAIPLLNKLGVKATFYISPTRAAKRLEGWKQAAMAGHEIGNHSMTHSCTANYRFSREKALEDYTLARMGEDLDRATDEIHRMLGVKPVSFAYPCGQKFIGRGAQARSYVPLVAKRFLSGRGYLDESANDPEVCDLAKLMGMGMDGLSLKAIRQLQSTAATEGRWLILVGHEVGEPAHQTTGAATLDALCREWHAPGSGVWLDTVRAISGYLRRQRKV